MKYCCGPVAAGVEFHNLSQGNGQHEQLLRYVSFLDSTALLKIRYQRTTQETNHKDQLFLNTFDIDSSHSFHT